MGPAWSCGDDRTIAASIRSGSVTLPARYAGVLQTTSESAGSACRCVATIGGGCRASSARL